MMEVMELQENSGGPLYQIYPRSFCDSNGDGIGDLPGITGKLDYLSSLGIGSLWISPFFRSPQKDFGYDVSGYLEVAPEYGTLDDAAELFAESHKRGIRILLDMVLNHTSEEHPWFRESCSDRTNPRRDWYIWRDGGRGRRAPNNWRSKIGGSGWHFHEATGQWYWASFLPFQPDLNYRNPEVRAAMFDVMRFWFDRGADGFRFDILGCLFKDASFRSNPLSLKFFPGGGEPGMLFRSAVMTENHPDTFQFVRELRKFADGCSRPSRFLIGEVFGNLKTAAQYCRPSGQPGLHSVFMFGAMDLPLKAGAWRKFIGECCGELGTSEQGGQPAWVLSNHDRARWISLHGNDERKAKLALTMILTLPGLPVIYYGEEIGMRQLLIPIENSKDAVAARFSRLPGILKTALLRLTRYAIHRDGCRTPMQWDGTSNAGFCPGEVMPWLPVHPCSTSVNVELLNETEGSLLLFMRAFLALRNSCPQLRTNYQDLNAGDSHRRNFKLNPSLKGAKTVLSFDRGDLIVYANFCGRKKAFSPGTNIKRILASTSLPPGEWGKDTAGGVKIPRTFPRFASQRRNLILRPWEAAVFQTE